MIDNGEPFAIAQADTPHEIFHTMDIPLVSNQWWSAYISAKQLSPRYFEVLDKLGFPSNSCRYCSLGLACTLDNDPATAPWGGLPKPTVLVARLTCECIRHVFGQWAEALGTEFFPLEAPGWTHKDPEWFNKSNGEWEELYEPRRIELLVQEMRALIELLEARTGRRFDEEKFVALMHAINEQEGYIAEAARLIGDARPCPVSIADQMPNTMIPAVASRLGLGGSACAAVPRRGGRTRRQAASRPAATNASGSCGSAPACGTTRASTARSRIVMARYSCGRCTCHSRARSTSASLHDRPMHALASRVCSMNEVLHLPPWMNGWMVSEAERCGIDAAVVLVPPDNRLSQSGTLLTQHALESAGVPALRLSADMVDAKEWNHERMVEHVAGFLRSKGSDMKCAAIGLLVALLLRAGALAAAALPA